MNIPDTKENQKKKQQVAQILEKLGSIEIFQAQLRDKFLKLLEIDHLSGIQDGEILYRIAKLTKMLYLNKPDLEFVKTNMRIFLQAMAHMINREHIQIS